MDKLIICITGMPGSGKKILREELIKLGRFPVVVMRHLVEGEMRAKGLKVDNVSLREFATNLRQQHGMAVVAERTIARVREIDSAVIIVDGVRGDAEIKRFNEEFGDNFVLIGVHTRPNIRFNRIKERKLEWDPQDLGGFEYRDNKELGWGLGNAIALSDYMVINEGSIDEFKDKIILLINKIVAEHKSLKLSDFFKG